MSDFKWNGNYKVIVSPNGESILMVYGRQICGSDRESTSLESLCVQLDEERDKYKKALEQCLIVLCCMNDLSHIKRQSKCIDIIEGALKS